MELIGTFGFKTSREVDKFAPFQTARDAHGVPYVTQDVAARFGCKVVDTLDAGTHMLIIGLVEEAEVLNTAAPMTYAYYHRVKNGLTPRTCKIHLPPSIVAISSWLISSYYNIFGQESRAASPAFPPSRA